MSEEESKTQDQAHGQAQASSQAGDAASAENLDDALKSLLGDLEKEPAAVPEALGLPGLDVDVALQQSKASAHISSAQELKPEQPQPESSPPKSSPPKSETSQETILPNPALQKEDSTSAAQSEDVVSAHDTKSFATPPFVATSEMENENSRWDATPSGGRKTPGNMRKRRWWPWLVLLLFAMLAGGAYYTRTHWLEKVKLRLHLGKPALVAQELPSNMDLPAMDAQFLPPTDSANDSSEEKSVLPAEAVAKPVAIAPTKPEPPKAALKVVEEPAKPVVQGPVPVVAMDSAEIHGVSGTLQGKVQYHCNVILYSSEGGLVRKLPAFDEALRVVIGNIFYFTVPGKANLPELERQVLQKAGFLFPEGKLVRVEVRGLELEPVQK